jgi:hypothetical protein
MAEPSTVSYPDARGPGRVASVAYRAIDIADRVWRKLHRMIDKAVVAMDARRR